MSENIYCDGIGGTVRVELADSYLDIRQQHGLLTVETTDNTFFSVNPTAIIAINWAVKIAENDYRIRLFLTDAVIDIDPLKEVNQTFLEKLFYWQGEWKKYLHPHHRQQLDQLKVVNPVITSPIQQDKTMIKFHPGTTYEGLTDDLNITVIERTNYSLKIKLSNGKTATVALRVTTGCDTETTEYFKLGINNYYAKNTVIRSK